MIQLDSELGKKLGFTSDKFLHMSYLWKNGSDVILSFIASTEHYKGYLKGLVWQTESLGYRVLVPTPLPQMKAILQHWGWIEEPVFDETLPDIIHVWHRQDNR